MPEGIRCSTVFLPAMTSVCPALCPPWKRTTPCARSVSQSTILPLPSSPHCVPITTTLRALIARRPPGFADRWKSPWRGAPAPKPCPPPPHPPHARPRPPPPPHTPPAPPPQGSEHPAAPPSPNPPAACRL